MRLTLSPKTSVWVRLAKTKFLLNHSAFILAIHVGCPKITKTSVLMHTQVSQKLLTATSSCNKKIAKIRSQPKNQKPICEHLIITTLNAWQIYRPLLWRRLWKSIKQFMYPKRAPASSGRATLRCGMSWGPGATGGCNSSGSSSSFP